VNHSVGGELEHLGRKKPVQQLAANVTTIEGREPRKVHRKEGARTNRVTMFKKKERGT